MASKKSHADDPGRVFPVQAFSSADRTAIVVLWRDGGIVPVPPIPFSRGMQLIVPTPLACH